MYKSLIEFLPPSTPFFHVAIIPDGARRWAVSNGKTFYESYIVMTECLLNILDLLYTKNVDIVTVYFSSVHNFKRPENQIRAFCSAEARFLQELVLPLAEKHGIKISIVGDRNNVPRDLIKSVEHAEALTINNVNKPLFLCIKYSSLAEIAVASNRAEYDVFVNHLAVPFPVDLLIRSGDAQVLSDFLLAQCAGARLFFLEKSFNDISTCEVEDILRQYANYELKYGE